jgi:hypothetical protein
MFWAPTDKALATSTTATKAPTAVNKMMRFKPHTPVTIFRKNIIRS